jgi:hypothetical protein
MRVIFPCWGSAPELCYCSTCKEVSHGEKNHTFQTSVWLPPEDIAWIDARLQEIKRMGGWRGVARSACIRSLIRAAMQRTPLHMEGVTREEELTERLSANYSFLKER